MTTMSDTLDLIRSNTPAVLAAMADLSALTERPVGRTDALRLAYRAVCRGGIQEISGTVIAEYHYLLDRAMARGCWSGHPIGQ
jgi:hypothetical protein